ncbi:DNA-binding transcriptional regulator, LysR family [Ferrimonas sediminum]|uniref:DNA-binding transcriptional regulator, LysR family n=1 Tax=Ferrimonas sediminum TaxID=718193 RepID=A0A1G8KQF8_9GAMM|nr:LysR family transcriptional regulator [Ferrimonas sediminum]SDI45596.1 DNA-binding transcriptional regulator, LysR family [Ferrimonas sediminum]
MKRINHLDFFSLSVFIELYEQKSGTAAAITLATTQPKVSRTLTMLRKTFNDELFTRHQHGMKPNRVADRLYPQAKQLVAGFQSLAYTMELTANEQGSINICAQEHFHRPLLSCLNELTSEYDNHFAFEVHPWTTESQKRLINRNIDYCISIDPSPIDGIAHYEIAPVGKYFLVANEDHPIFNAEITLHQILRYKLAILNYAFDETKVPRLQAIADQKNLPISVALKISDLGLLLDHVKECNSVGLVVGTAFQSYLQSQPGLTCMNVSDIWLNETKSHQSLQYYLQAHHGADQAFAARLASSLRQRLSAA